MHCSPKNENISNIELAEESQNQLLTNRKKKKVYSPFIDNIWGADPADMQLINKFNKGFKISIKNLNPCVVCSFKR